MNYVKLVGREEADKRAKNYTKKALSALEIFGDKAKELVAFSDFLINRIN